MALDAISAYIAAIQLIMEGDQICSGAKVNGFGRYSCLLRSRLGSRLEQKVAGLRLNVVGYALEALKVEEREHLGLGVLVSPHLYNAA